MSYKVYFITGGGTGGHVYPAFTVAEKLLQDSNNNKVFYIGNPKNIEYEISKRNDKITFLGVDVGGMPRKLSLSLLYWVVKLFLACFKSVYYILRYKPNAIFATGGYVSAPIVFAARLLKKPYMIHDCDSEPGLVSKISAPGAKIVSVAFENSRNKLKSKNIICNGNPIREDFFKIDKETARKTLGIPLDKKVILAMGGSQGAKTINTAIINILKTLSESMGFFVILQTGKNKYEEVMNELKEIYPNYKQNQNVMVRPYFDDMVYPMKAADLIVARAGSLSLTEILQCAAASILVPYPYAAQDHQRKNAKEMCDKGVSLYLEDSECNGNSLLDLIKKLDESQITQMQNKAKELAITNPTEVIVAQLKSIMRY